MSEMHYKYPEMTRHQVGNESKLVWVEGGMRGGKSLLFVVAIFSMFKKIFFNL